MTRNRSDQPRTPDGKFSHKTTAADPGRLGDLAAQTAPAPWDSDDPDWWWEHGKTWVKNTATPAELKQVVDDTWPDVPDVIAEAVYRDDCPTEVVDAALSVAGGYDEYNPHLAAAAGRRIGRAARHPNRPDDWADTAARVLDGSNFVFDHFFDVLDGFFDEFDGPLGERRRGLKSAADTAALLDAHLGDDARIEVAARENTPPEILVRLAGDPNGAVRSSVAYNPATPPELLAGLAADPDRDVRLAAATNPNLPAAGRAAAGLLAD